MRTNRKKRIYIYCCTAIKMISTYDPKSVNLPICVSSIDEKNAICICFCLGRLRLCCQEGMLFIPDKKKEHQRNNKSATKKSKSMREDQKKSKTVRTKLRKQENPTRCRKQRWTKKGRTVQKSEEKKKTEKHTREPAGIESHCRARETKDKSRRKSKPKDETKKMVCRNFARPPLLTLQWGFDTP